MIPLPEKELYNPASGMVLSTIEWSVNSIYECNNKEQLTKYYQASLGSHPKSTLIAAAKTGYLQGCPGFTVSAVSKVIAIEETTEAGHMRQLPKGTRSTSSTANRGKYAAHSNRKL